jgi:carboxyl-terminal processing protease
LNLTFGTYVTPYNLGTIKLSQASIGASVEALDYVCTACIDAADYGSALDSMEGKCEGIGMYVQFKDGQIALVAPISDSAAAKASTGAGDLVLAINGEPTSKMSLIEAVIKVRRPKDTPVILLAGHHDDNEAKEMTVMRAEIKIESIRIEMKGDAA